MLDVLYNYFVSGQIKGKRVGSCFYFLVFLTEFVHCHISKDQWYYAKEVSAGTVCLKSMIFRKI